MKNIINKVNIFLFGNPYEITLENRIFSIATFIGALGCLLSFLINMFSDFPLALNGIILTGSILFAVFFYLSSFKKIIKPLEIPFQIIAVFIIGYSWFATQGVEGSSSNYFYLATLILIYCNSKKKYWTVLLFIILISIVLLLIQMFFPSLIIHYPNKNTQTIDLSSSLIIAIFLFGALCILIKQTFDKERAKIEEQKLELQKSKKILRELNNELENKVMERTTELAEINKKLQKEIIIKQEVIKKEKELNMLKSRFISVVSHEFKTPLAGIESSAQLLERFEQKWDLEMKEKMFNRIHGAVKYMNFLLDDASLIEKDEAGELQFKQEQLKIIELLKNISEEINILFGLEHKIKFIPNIKTNNVLLDINLVKHILYNILSNAIKYSDSKDFVIFDVIELPNNKLKFTITDKGIGIPDDDKKYIFKLFHRAKNAMTIKGTGLGLSIVKRCVEKHSGTIEIESKENVGTTVTVIIPFDLP